MILDRFRVDGTAKAATSQMTRLLAHERAERTEGRVRG